MDFFEKQKNYLSDPLKQSIFSVCQLVSVCQSVEYEKIEISPHA